jgi:hypothetical protein
LIVLRIPEEIQSTQFGTAGGLGIKGLITEAALLVEDALVLCVGDLTPWAYTNPDSSNIANWRGIGWSYSDNSDFRSLEHSLFDGD